MKKIREILIGTNNTGKYREICALLPKEVKKYSLNEFKISSPDEIGKNFEENSLIKASYFSKKTNLVCLSDDSGLEIDLLKGAPGIYSSRWAGNKKDFNVAINKVFDEMNKVKTNWKGKNSAKFTCCLTLFWPDGKNFLAKGIIKGKISEQKKGDNGFGYDPIFIPLGYKKTFGEMKPKLKMSMDHRYKAYLQIKKFFC
ncbi:RdgB/HAM1 family non-canonical purine NTP pyrophosphatase [Pelagibacteraceae bacterium]|nr:RdgB/HAM1 family non-canonical purine NTP pyrophosphatase [Pelagibacteraceae bacterium]